MSECQCFRWNELPPHAEGCWKDIRVSEAERAKLKARVELLRDRLDHLVHLNRGVNKGGLDPAPSDWDGAWTDAEAALEQEEG